MKDEGQQKKPSTYSIIPTAKTGVGKCSLINSRLSVSTKPHLGFFHVI